MVVHNFLIFLLCVHGLAASQYQTETQMKKKKRKAADPTESDPITEQRRKELEHFLKLKRYDEIQPFYHDMSWWCLYNVKTIV